MVAVSRGRVVEGGFLVGTVLIVDIVFDVVAILAVVVLGVVTGFSVVVEITIGLVVGLLIAVASPRTRWSILLTLVGENTVL